MEQNLWRIFSAVSDAVPDRECIVWRDIRRSYAEVADRASRTAVLLNSLDVGVTVERSSLAPWQSGQDTVGLYLLNGPEYLESMLGAFAGRAAPFNVNYHYTAEELAYLFSDSGIKALVFHSRFAPTVTQLLTQLRTPTPVLIQVADDSGLPLVEGAIDYEASLRAIGPLGRHDHSADDLYILYTGGTTGPPKGTLWRQADAWIATMGGDRFVDCDLEAIVDAAVTERPHRFLPNAPFMHGAAQWVAMRCLLSGGAVVVNDVVDRLDPVEVWTTLARERCDSTLMVGEAFARPLIAELSTGNYDVSTLRLVMMAGAPTSTESKSGLLDLAQHVVILDGAGASETGAGLMSISKRGSQSTPGLFDASDVALVIDAAMEHILQPGDDDVGWYAKRGHIPLGYLGDEERTRRTFPTIDGERLAVPGDRARWHSDGRIHLLGRDAATINTGGEKVFAEEVEAALLRQPSVEDALVIGQPSDRWGEAVVAILAVSEGAALTDAELRHALSSSLAKYKLPKRFIRVTKVQRNSAGKPNYSWARELASTVQQQAATSTNSSPPEAGTTVRR